MFWQCDEREMLFDRMLIEPSSRKEYFVGDYPWHATIGFS
jgi:hypothetical protein